MINGGMIGCSCSSGGQGNSLTTSFTNQASINVVHNFNGYPVINVLDNSDDVLVPLTITHNSLNDFTVTFTSSSTGKIISVR